MSRSQGAWLLLLALVVSPAAAAFPNWCFSGSPAHWHQRHAIGLFYIAAGTTSFAVYAAMAGRMLDPSVVANLRAGAGTRLQAAYRGDMRVINIHQITFAQSFYIGAYVAQWCPFYDGGFNLLQSIVVRDLDPHLPVNNNLDNPVNALGETLSVVWVHSGTGVLCCSCPDFYWMGDPTNPGSHHACKHIMCVQCGSGPSGVYANAAQAMM